MFVFACFVCSVGVVLYVPLQKDIACLAKGSCHVSVCSCDFVGMIFVVLGLFCLFMCLLVLCCCFFICVSPLFVLAKGHCFTYKRTLRC